MSRIPIALQLYSVRHDLDADLRGTLQAVADMGYEGVEFGFEGGGVGGGPGVDWPAGQQHLHGRFASDSPCDGYHRGRAEESYLDTRRCKFCALFRHGQVAPRHQLTVRGRGGSLDLSNDGLGRRRME